MKTTILAAFLMLISTVLLAQLDVQAAQAVAEQGEMVGVMDYLKEINFLNIALLAFSVFAGSLWFQGRNKLKEIGEIFLKAYEYTDDKKLTAAERADLIARFMSIVGKSKYGTVVTPSPDVEEELKKLPESTETVEKKKKFRIFKKKG